MSRQGRQRGLSVTVRRVLRMGDPRLRRVSGPVTSQDRSGLASLLQDMRDTMSALNGVGLAAPQIGVALRVVLFGTGASNPRYPDAEIIPPTVLINPELELLGSQTQLDWEGCLSVPGLRGMVPRHRDLHYRGVDEHGREIDRRVSGFHARVVQHEVDHLDGILYPMRMEDLSQFGFVEELFPDRPAPEE